ncbi:MAG TPA: hypothetical protein VMW65_12940 [Chloroflexota bacterium]|nr:hypothetical protein [Chloroflexota bacterium]
MTRLVLGFVLALAAIVPGCAAGPSGPALLYSYRTSVGNGQRPEVFVAAVASPPDNEPIAMTVLDPTSGRALDTFHLDTTGVQPCGLGTAASADTRYGVLDDRYIPFNRWEAAARGADAPYRIRLYFRSITGTIWETEVSARYSGCPNGTG